MDPPVQAKPARRPSQGHFFSENVLKRLTNLENMKFEKVLIEARVHTVGSFLDTQIVSNRTSALVSTTVGWNSTGSNRQKLFLRRQTIRFLQNLLLTKDASLYSLRRYQV